VSNSDLTSYLVRAVAMLLLASAFVHGCAYDDTDHKPSGRRSGMRLYIDHGTGCHYLSAPSLLSNGTLIPRYDPDTGRQYCGPVR
jgi:hypothetical protein